MLSKSGWPTWQVPTSKSTGTLVRSRVRSLLSTATSTTGFAHVRTEIQSVRGELLGRMGRQFFWILGLLVASILAPIASGLPVITISICGGLSVSSIIKAKNTKGVFTSSEPSRLRENEVAESLFRNVGL